MAQKAIDQVNKQRRRALGSMANALNSKGKALPLLQADFTKQWGLPCAHHLLEIVNSGPNLQKADLAQCRWLQVPLDIEFPHMRFKDLEKAKEKGRPRGLWSVRDIDSRFDDASVNRYRRYHY